MRMFIDQGAAAVVAQVRWPGGEWSKAYGVRDLDSKQPAQPDDLVSVASVTKTMTAVSVMKLVDEGLIGLDDPVNGILPSFTTVLRPPGPITVRQLLGHTSGMPSFGEAVYRTVDNILPAVEQRLSLQRGLELTGTLPWEAKDVGSFGYSDSNYLALGQLLETLRGKPYAEVLRDDVIRPLGLTRTTVDDLHSGAPDVIHGYITIRGERVGGGVTPSQLDSPSHGVVSTMSDVNNFLAALFRGQLVSAKSLEEMKASGPVPLFGLGMLNWSQDCTGAARHGGRGGFWDYRTVAMSSADGRYQASMTMVPGPMPSPLEDPESENKHALWSDQIASALLETLDRLCQR
ncbi:MAG: hypothetical protein JWQ75_471 [Pseudarthrobacter sp.]|nr:hypothetical protein [Pseudarthrobacter sp.]